MRYRPILSRRTLMRGGAAAVGVLALRPQLWSPQGPPLAVVAPDPAHALVDAFGVVTHLHFADTGYADHAKVAYWLSLLGVRQVRNRLSLQPEVLDAFDELSRRGIRIQGVCGALGDPQSMDQILEAVVARYPDPSRVFAAFEGINEPNNDGVPWIDETRAQTQALREARDSRGLSAIPIVAPALARVDGGGVEGDTTFEQAGNLGDLSAYVDFGNIHVYPRGLQPSVDIDYFESCAVQVSGDLPIMCTEGGYFTATDYSGPASPVPLAVAAAYTPQMLLEHWLAGNPRFFRYELFDDPGASAERESSFGMVQTRSLGSVELPLPKPDFVAMRRMLAMFSDRGATFTAAPLAMSLSGPPELRSALFAKRDGSHLLCLWLDQPIYDPDTGELTQDLLDQTASAEVSWTTPRDSLVESLVDPERADRTAATSSLKVGLTAGVTVVTLAAPG